MGKQAIPPPQADAPQTGFGAMAQAAMASPSNQYYATADLGDGQGRYPERSGRWAVRKFEPGRGVCSGGISRWAADTFRFQ